jgi:hypothetical protein
LQWPNCLEGDFRPSGKEYVKYFLQEEDQELCNTKTKEEVEEAIDTSLGYAAPRFDRISARIYRLLKGNLIPVIVCFFFLFLNLWN